MGLMCSLLSTGTENRPAPHAWFKGAKAHSSTAADLGDFERTVMTSTSFVASHEKDARFERGLRSFYEYRDLGVKEATQGRVDAHVIRAAAGNESSSQPHLHRTSFQLVYILKGWIEFEYERQGVVRLEAGPCVHQPPSIRHRELGHSADIEMLEIVLPAGFETEEVSSVNESSP
jgi:quercetin dioxygenase-like cupin family protein